MKKTVSTNFNFLIKIGSYREAFDFLLSLPLTDDKNFLEEIGRRFENLGDSLPLYKGEKNRDLALRSYDYAKTFYINADVKQRAEFLDELLESDISYTKSIKQKKDNLRKKKL